MKRVYINQVPIDSIDMNGALQWISTLMHHEPLSTIHVVTPNAQFVQIARSNTRFAHILHHSDLSLADGVPLVWACRLLGQSIPGRVNGTDFMIRLSEWASKNESSVYLLGGRPGAAAVAADRLIEAYPGLRIAGIDCPPMGFMGKPDLDAAVTAKILDAAPDILFVGLGAPKQEFWIQDHRQLPTKVMVGVGGSFELVAGVTKRAPGFMRKSGLEWLWRLFMEPRRLFTRYLIGNILFILIVLRQWCSMAISSNGEETLAGKLRKQAK